MEEKPKVPPMGREAKQTTIGMNRPSARGEKTKSLSPLWVAEKK
jgi:hypothetical protein